MEIRRYDKKLMRSGFSVSRKNKIFPQCVLLLLYKLISSKPTLVLLVPKVQLSDDCETLCNICMAFFGLFLASFYFNLRAIRKGIFQEVLLCNTSCYFRTNCRQYLDYVFQKMEALNKNIMIHAVSLLK